MMGDEGDGGNAVGEKSISELPSPDMHPASSPPPPWDGMKQQHQDVGPAEVDGSRPPAELQGSGVTKDGSRFLEAS